SFNDLLQRAREWQKAGRSPEGTKDKVFSDIANVIAGLGREKIEAIVDLSISFLNQLKVILQKDSGKNPGPAAREEIKSETGGKGAGDTPLATKESVERIREWGKIKDIDWKETVPLRERFMVWFSR